MRQAPFWDISFHPVPASSSLLRLLYAGCLLFRRSWFPFPLSQTAPFCGGKGWFNNSQLRALQRSWQACLPEYALHKSVYVCVSMCMRVCGWSTMHILKHMTRAPPQDCQMMLHWLHISAKMSLLQMFHPDQRCWRTCCLSIRCPLKLMKKMIFLKEYFSIIVLHNC